MKGFFPALIGMAAFTVLFLTSCSPKYAKEKEVVSYVMENVPEEVELVGKVEGEDHKWTFRCTNRDIVFTARTTADTVNIDGANFGYTGKYHIGMDYQDKVYSYYNDIMTDIMRKHRFLAENETIFSYEKESDDLMRSYLSNSHTFGYCKEFNIVLNNNTYDWDYRYVDAFLDDVRKEIVQKEYDTTGTILDIRYEVYLKIDDDHYQRTGGTNSNYTSSIIPDEEVHIRDTIRLTNMMLSNVIPPVNNGMLIEIEDNPEKTIREDKSE